MHLEQKDMTFNGSMSGDEYEALFRTKYEDYLGFSISK